MSEHKVLHTTKVATYSGEGEVEVSLNQRGTARPYIAITRPGYLDFVLTMQAGDAHTLSDVLTTVARLADRTAYDPAVEI